MSYKRIKIIACVLAVALCFSATGCTFGHTPDIAPHLISARETDPVRPIDDRPEIAMSEFDGDFSRNEKNAARVDELFSIVVYENAKPRFSQSDDPLKIVYDNAISVLDGIILNAWHDSADGELNIVHSVHDYLACNIEYDFDLYERYKANADGDEFKYDPAFDISGVFSNGVAVCDGLSRAVVFLCAIESVESVRITGTYGGVTHAWNKVKVDGVWYNMDVTADMANYNINGGAYFKQLSHGYFLVSDATMQGFKPTAHVFAHEIYPAPVDYDYYRNKYVAVGDCEFKCVVKSQDELNAVFEAIYKNRRTAGKIELKLDFDGKADVNGADMYKAEIAAAYKKVKFADFKISGETTPYFRYPNGVYLFLIYK